ncbi:MAG TPA: AraC family transcriptional regulator [Pyrinomonadaceae bacterium]|nr:AraC family transcriptional regulator [Pyrinomonadaceae bacterium]
MIRMTEPTKPLQSVFKPCFCVIAQGSKTVTLGDEKFSYDEGNYLIATMDLPVESCVVEASESKPYLSVVFELDPSLVAEVMLECGINVSGSATVRAVNVSSIEPELLDAAVRVVRLLDSPEDTKMMLPLLKKELIYRLLRGNQAARLAHLLAGEDHRISRAIDTLRKNYDRPLRIETIARDLGMSVSGFHFHFKSVTAMSPLQYQKSIRLQEARRLMLAEDYDAASAGFRVGYEDAAYFSRDYKRHFGEPPQRDVARLRGQAATQ